MTLSDEAVVPNKGSTGDGLHRWCLGLIRRPRGGTRLLCWRLWAIRVSSAARFEGEARCKIDGSDGSDGGSKGATAGTRATRGRCVVGGSGERDVSRTRALNWLLSVFSLTPSNHFSRPPPVNLSIPTLSSYHHHYQHHYNTNSCIVNQSPCPSTLQRFSISRVHA